MDNDIEIEKKDNTNLAHREVQTLLKNELQNLEFNKPTAYDLEIEYAKTKKNHNFGVWAMLIICFAVVGFAAYGVSRFVTTTDENIKIDISTFDDLNLRSLLNMVGRTEGLYQSATKRRAELQASLDYELKQASEKRDNDLFTLQSLSLRDKKEVARRTSAIQKEYKTSVETLHAKYDVDIQTAENEIKQYQDELSSYDSNKVAHAQEQEAAIDSQRQLHDLEMERQSKKYDSEVSDLHSQLSTQQQESVKRQRAAVSEVTKKYQAEIALLDPVIKDARGNTIVSTAKSAGTPTSYSATDYSAKVLPGETLSSALDRVQKMYKDFDYTSNFVSAIPQFHSIPSYVTAMKVLAYQIGTTVSEAAATESAELQKRNAAQKKTIDAQSVYFESLLTNGNEKFDGMILSAGNKSSMPVYVSKSADANFAKSVKNEAGETVASIKHGKTIVDFFLKDENGLFIAYCADEKNASEINTGDKFSIKVVEQK